MFRVRILKVLLPAAAMAMMFVSCLKKEEYPAEPQIKFVSFTKIQNEQGIDEKGILKISFTDGDGDIGLSEGDTMPPYNLGSQWYYNFFIDYYEKQQGVLQKIELPSTMNSRIPYLTGTGNNKPTKGEIEIELYIFNPTSNYDTIAFGASIADRDLNVSNAIMTPEIILKKH